MTHRNWKITEQKLKFHRSALSQITHTRVTRVRVHVHAGCTIAESGAECRECGDAVCNSSTRLSTWVHHTVCLVHRRLRCVLGGYELPWRESRGEWVAVLQ